MLSTLPSPTPRAALRVRAPHRAIADAVGGILTPPTVPGLTGGPPREAGRVARGRQCRSVAL